MAINVKLIFILFVLKTCSCFYINSFNGSQNITLPLRDGINCTLNVDVIDSKNKILRITLMVDDSDEDNNIRDVKAVGSFSKENYYFYKYFVTKDFCYKNVQELVFFSVEHRFESHIYMKFYTFNGFGRTNFAKIQYLSTDIPPKQVIHYTI